MDIQIFQLFPPPDNNIDNILRYSIRNCIITLIISI